MCWTLSPSCRPKLHCVGAVSLLKSRPLNTEAHSSSRKATEIAQQFDTILCNQGST